MCVGKSEADHTQFYGCCLQQLELQYAGPFLHSRC